LFLICGEAFSSLLNSAEESGQLEGVKICHNTPSFNHLLFANDSLILSAQHLQLVLNLYEHSTGQTINVDNLL
jgi:hypothetical protein